MANPQHIEWLLEGVEAWNARRDAEDFVPDFSEANLRKAFKDAGKLTWGTQIPLSHANLRRADLRGANLEAANLEAADLGGADLRVVDLRGAKLRSADLGAANLIGAYLGGANLVGAYLIGANLEAADVSTTVHSGVGTNAAHTAETTNLATIANLSQEHLDSMNGDTGTILPDHLTRPAHWPDWRDQIADAEKAATANAPQSATPPSTPQTDPNYRLQVQERSLSDLRTALTHSYATPAALANYMVAQLQIEIAAHKLTPPPNEKDGLSAWTAKANMLNEMMVAVQQLAGALPLEEPPEITNQAAQSIKDRLIALAAQLDGLIKSLDDDTGTLGNFWKVGVIAAASHLLVACGIGIASAAPIAAGVVGVSTFKVWIGKVKSSPAKRRKKKKSG